MSFIEKKILHIKKSLDKVFLYQRWTALFKPWLIIIFILASTIFYFGIKVQPIQRIGYLEWMIAKMAGVKPESIGYSGRGWFNISGLKRSVVGEVEPVKISFNPLNQLFSSDKTDVSYWNKKLRRQINYSMDITDTGDVWLDKRNKQIHGKLSADKIIWDQPQRVGIRAKASGHQLTVQDGKLNIIDE